MMYPDSKLLQKNEQKALEILAEAFNAFLLLDTLHPNDAREFEMHIHGAQNIILSRPAMREIREE